MLTIFSVPKPFAGHIGVIQRNAIQSWARLHPSCEIILCGDESGTEGAATEFGAKHIPNIARNEYGTPLLSSVFDQVQHVASCRLMCYVNADIILLSDFTVAVKRIRRLRRFLMFGQRYDVKVTGLLDFSDPEWETRLRFAVSEYGRLHPHTGVDYYVFPKMLWDEIPPFAIGRTSYDNWLIYSARLSGVRVIDATQVVTCVHQDHERSYASLGLRNLWGIQGLDDLRTGPEARKNLELAGEGSRVFALKDATHALTPTGLKMVLTKWRLLRLLDTIPLLHPWLAPFWRMAGLPKLRRLVYRLIWG